MSLGVSCLFILFFKYAHLQYIVIFTDYPKKHIEGNEKTKMDL